MQFLHMKLGHQVEIPDDQITKHRVVTTNPATGKSRVSYMFKALAEDGQKLVKFCGRAAYEAHPGSETVEEKVKGAA